MDQGFIRNQIVYLIHAGNVLRCAASKGDGNKSTVFTKGLPDFRFVFDTCGLESNELPLPNDDVELAFCGQKFSCLMLLLNGSANNGGRYDFD